MRCSLHSFKFRREKKEVFFCKWPKIRTGSLAKAFRGVKKLKTKKKQKKQKKTKTKKPTL